MRPIPKDKSLDSTLALFRDGYNFISNRCRRYQSDFFETRLMLQKAICMKGAEAARVFYDETRFQRHGAMPKRGLKSFLGEGGVQVLDGEAHRRRKQMFMSLMTAENIQRRARQASEHWRARLDGWEGRGQVVLFDEAQEIFCRAVCAWAGVPLQEAEVKKRAGDFGAMIDSPAAIGPRHWRGRWARRRAEKWAGYLIEDVRAGKLKAAEASASHAIAWHREPNGELLNRRVAAVELINILRPTVAIARFVTFAALAMFEHPECREKLRAGEEGYDELFVQEVRRFYPFFPAVPALVRQAFEWKGYQFPLGRWVILDLYGTNHDERIWEKPESFWPERFRRRDISPFDLIPQGGGDYKGNHRCPGEWVTIELMKVALHSLTRSITYDVPAQDLRVSLSRIPALPKSRFVITNIARVS
jgi:fatty-acid peroxygenase